MRMREEMAFIGAVSLLSGGLSLLIAALIAGLVGWGLPLANSELFGLSALGACIGLICFRLSRPLAAVSALLGAARLRILLLMLTTYGANYALGRLFHLEVNESHRLAWLSSAPALIAMSIDLMAWFRRQLSSKRS